MCVYVVTNPSPAFILASLDRSTVTLGCRCSEMTVFSISATLEKVNINSTDKNF